MTLTVVYLLREVSDFGNFSTDTGSTLAEESTAVPYRANFLFNSVYHTNSAYPLLVYCI